MKNLSLGIAALAVAGAATVLIVQYASHVKLRGENEALRQQVAELRSPDGIVPERFLRAHPRVDLPAPPARDLPARLRPDSDTSAERLARLFTGEVTPRLTWDQVHGFLDENHRSAHSLLAAYRTTGDARFLEEAAEAYPDNPQVAFEAIFLKNASAEDRRRRLDAFKESAPDNALPNYLSALDHFGAGETGRAIEDLLDAFEKPRFDDYTLHRLHANEEAFRSAGLDEAETTSAATWGIPLPHGAALRELSGDIVDLARAYRQAGDEDSAQVALHLTLGIAEHIRDSRGGSPVPLIKELVSISIERAALSEMDPGELYDGAGQTVQDRLEHLGQRTDAIRETVAQVEALHDRITPRDWVTYNARTISLGEENAAEWLLNKYRRE